MTKTSYQVLAVDDNRMTRLKMTRALQGGYEVSQAQGGEEALALLRSRPFHLVLLDIEMPGLDGFEVLRRMKEESSLRDIPVIVVSGMEDTTSFERCLEIGAVDYIAKPFDLPQLKACVDSHLDTG
jgi:CheY-like chemotaxis protein